MLFPRENQSVISLQTCSNIDLQVNYDWMSLSYDCFFEEVMVGLRVSIRKWESYPKLSPNIDRLLLWFSMSPFRDYVILELQNPQSQIFG